MWNRARLWNPDPVHLLPADRSDHRVIDAERICQAIEALDGPEIIAARARQFAVLGDPTRLTLLTAIKAAGPISVSDLAAATGINDTTQQLIASAVETGIEDSLGVDGTARLIRQVTDGDIHAPQVGQVLQRLLGIELHILERE